MHWQMKCKIYTPKMKENFKRMLWNIQMNMWISHLHGSVLLKWQHPQNWHTDLTQSPEERDYFRNWQADWNVHMGPISGLQEIKLIEKNKIGVNTVLLLQNPVQSSSCVGPRWAQKVPSHLWDPVPWWFSSSWGPGCKTIWWEKDNFQHSELSCRIARHKQTKTFQTHLMPFIKWTQVRSITEMLAKIDMSANKYRTLRQKHRDKFLWSWTCQCLVIHETESSVNKERLCFSALNASVPQRILLR